MQFVVYILYSPGFKRFYIGQTNNLDSRIQRHNSGRESFTKKYMPWDLIAHFEKEDRSEAMKLERKLKNLNRTRLIDFISRHKPESLIGKVF